jgi:hypothetical protein
VSRSVRKPPIIGISTAKSEAADKRRWHAKLRSGVRSSLKALPPDQIDSYIAPVEVEAVNVWSMTKEGKQYFGKSSQAIVAQRLSKVGKTTIERQSLKARLLKKFMGK